MDEQIPSGSGIRPPTADVAYPKLLIECGEESLREYRDGEADLLLEIETIEDIAANHGIDLEILIYSGVASPLSGGRPDKITLTRCEQLAGLLNARGLRFCLAINGGLTLRPELAADVLAEVDPLLDILARSGHAHGLANSVVITHPALHTYVQARYPTIETIASCIQPLYPFATHDYRTAFEEYDFVVPLNQHATPEFLGQYRGFVDRMLVFLTLGCGIAHYAKCYRHYVDIESEYRTDAGSMERVNPKSLDVVACQLTDPYRTCDDGALIAREADLVGLLQMGVRKFKIPRNGLLRRSVFERLLELFDRYHPDGSSRSIPISEARDDARHA